MENPCVAYCEELISLASEREDIVLVTADSADPLALTPFRERYPERFFDMGIAEQAMTNVAGGLASVGFTPFVSAFAMFQALRACDNVRNGIAYPGLNVKLVSANIGLNVGKNGVTHHALEDLAIMRTIPSMTVVSPADARATRRLVREAASTPGPVYMRIDKCPTPIVYGSSEMLQIGKGHLLKDGRDVVIFATGATVHLAIQAAELLRGSGIEAAVVDIHTIKPLDDALIIHMAAGTRAVVTVEQHSIIGGLGGAVSELLGGHLPTPVERVGVRDVFTESGSPVELNEKYGISVSGVVNAVHNVLRLKR
ncbi:MAG: transketolase family protein [Alicyclobacillus macrosporangiidus]|uniref:transketolase family protein n=1 Tax=Alicyclobacillus macrosporangiidus TaxID=392015 RepID=UPI0026EDDEA2|nr:transketolase C-terminal domain-containing protein [Alicyclobacillus macrosporangiidus]MCL6597603.1 transketolase family protein [Alicyclobacillus macrosporangiidus]